MSGNEKRPIESGTPTSCRRQREELVRRRKEIDQKTGTHHLETVERDVSGHGKKPTERMALTNYRR
jgi:hypothetical protein